MLAVSPLAAITRSARPLSCQQWQHLLQLLLLAFWIFFLFHAKCLSSSHQVVLLTTNEMKWFILGVSPQQKWRKSVSQSVACLLLHHRCLSKWLFCVLQVFEGNTNSGSVVHNDFKHTILTRYIRFIPVDWSSKGRIGVRLELYGCSYCKYRLMGNAGSIRCPFYYYCYFFHKHISHII